MTFGPGTDRTVSPGAVLASARQAAGLSVADVAAQMRLAPRQVEALEADRYAELPGAVFVRGFVRNYARVLKLDPAPLLNALEPALDQEAPLRMRATSGALPLAARRDHARPLLIVFFVIVAVGAAGGGYELWRRQQEQPEPPRSSAQSGAGTAQSVVVPAENLQQPAPKVLSETSPPAAPAQEAPAAIEGAGAQAPPDPAPAAPPPAIAPARLRVEFAADCWLEVRDREGIVLFSGTGPAGSERTFEANPPLSVVIGNASGVRITYNDRAVDLAPHAARNIARLTLE